MKTEIWVTYYLGIHEVTFKKTFQLPFVPVMGMDFLDENKDGDEIRISFEDDKETKTRMEYNAASNSFFINVRSRLYDAMSDSYFDEEVKLYLSAGWECLNTKDVEKIKNLMNQVSL